MSFLRWLLGIDRKIHKHRMLENEVITQARAIADENGWEWREPVTARTEQRGDSIVWVVLSHADVRGGNVQVVIDDTTGEILEKTYLPV